MKLPPAQLKLIMDSVVWAFKHTMRDIADTGLSICLDMINNFTASDPAIAQAFYQAYFLNLLNDVFYVLTDNNHKSGFKLQSQVLARMFYLVETGAVQAPLFTPAQAQEMNDPNLTNASFLRNYMVNLLQNAFPHVQPTQVRSFTMALFETNRDANKFKLHLRDFLIQLTEFGATETEQNELYLDEREAEVEAKRKSDREAALRIPGLVKPSELPTMDEDD